jgi:hypothetical protein
MAYLFVYVNQLGGLDQAVDAVAVCPTPEPAHLAQHLILVEAGSSSCPAKLGSVEGVVA